MHGIQIQRAWKMHGEKGFKGSSSYRQDPDGSWSHKTGEAYPITGVIDPIADAKFRGYIDIDIVGYFYVTGGVYENKE